MVRYLCSSTEQFYAGVFCRQQYIREEKNEAY